MSEIDIVEGGEEVHPVWVSPRSEERYKSKTLTRLFRLLEVLRTDGWVSITEVAERLGCHKNSIFRDLWNLEHAGLLVRDAADRYALGPGIVELARAVPRRIAASRAALERELFECLGDHDA